MKAEVELQWRGRLDEVSILARKFDGWQLTKEIEGKVEVMGR